MSRPSRKYVVGLVGFKESGKDTLCSIMQSWYPQAVRVAFADPLKVEVYDALSCEAPVEDTTAMLKLARGLGLDLRDLWPAGKVSKKAKLDWVDAHKRVLRPILQNWGTEVRRTEDPLYWIRKLDQDVRDADTDLVVVTDVRFPNEGDYVVRGCGGILVRVLRKDRPVTKDTHSSERYAAEARVAFEVINPGTTVEEFEAFQRDRLKVFLDDWRELRGAT